MIKFRAVEHIKNSHIMLRTHFIWSIFSSLEGQIPKSPSFQFAL